METMVKVQLDKEEKLVEEIDELWKLSDVH